MSRSEELHHRENRPRLHRDPLSRELQPHSRPRDPHPRDPYPIDSQPRDPYPRDPHPRDPQPIDSHPRDPHPIDPHPRDPHPRDPHPRDPHPRDPHPRDPHPRDPHPRDPYPRDPHPRDPHPRDPYPRDPHPIDPHPRDPYPRDPHPIDPHPRDPDPRDPYPIDSHPRDPYPRDPDPRDPHPIDSHPRDPYPRDPHPRDPDPRDPYPIDSHPRDPHPRDPLPQDLSPRDPEPRSFLHSLRTLFDILDQEGRGWVELREIESRWPGEGRREPALPAGLMGCLRRAAAPSGRLTFPRLLAGIRAALQQEAGSPEPDSAPGCSRYQQPGKSRRDTPAGGHRSWAAAAADHKGPGIGCSQNVGASMVLGTLRCSDQEDNGLRQPPISNGNHDNMLKELECQRDALLHGLEVVEWARDWYRQQIRTLHQRQGHIRRAVGKKVRFSAPRVDGFRSPLGAESFQQQPISSLKEQNYLLTKELSSKRERVTTLEQEKASLVKRLMEDRGAHAQLTPRTGTSRSPPPCSFPH
ncbi:suppressor APC domain-containing protein 2-like isoform X2 [Hemiscyllium ocellatum]|uniref:suppressor APC domain-containing protein 2-like isoform X2 n=1 Tax=Hemiscyllium ocellatum TaxID=170820 RepID=UPI00296679EC|nr:suppressor APC domain-containing protein 2-like isoform X2 [Hemiscyllium ocellatum]